MLLIQSRGQNIFNRFYLLFSQFFWMFIGGALVALINQQSIDYISYFLYPAIMLFTLYTLWLIVFNSGKSKIIEYGLALDEQEISYIKYGSKQKIAWSDFTGFEIKHGFPRMVLLKSADKQNIVFSYYTFSSSQRRALFDYLSAK
ncbi:hypothetical protein [Thalassomonas actiniarum]|uniref:Uncharacterized protein n=1 Tax=Thalassomonas actiniarum TaxID=485447 RepID=A0AAE9YL01_9GAMM|nr:hypothetical protein [Thalassomonas actiniarum]WDD97212.1 hypothetical protein SG35_017930 [Thalassomonas actiniarum]